MIFQIFCPTRKFISSGSNNKFLSYSIHSAAIQGSPVVYFRKALLRVVHTQGILFLEIDVVKSRIRYTTTLKVNEFLDRLKMDWKLKFRVVLCWTLFFPTSISKIKSLGSALLLNDLSFCSSGDLNFRMPLAWSPFLCKPCSIPKSFIQ